MSPKAKRQYQNMMHILLLVILTSMGKFILYDPYIKSDMGINTPLTASAGDAIDNTEVASNQKVTLIAVGDVMMHDTEMKAGYDAKTDTYSFDDLFINIKPFLSGDIVYANLETPVAGKELKYGGYPNFNAPNELLDALKNSYFTHLSLANNHALDRGAVGLSNTVKNVENLNFVALGARNDNSKNNFEITEINGVRFGFLSYTYGTNGLKLSDENSYMLSYINKVQIKKDIIDLKSKGVDVTIATFHFGEEYRLTENEYQKDIASFACANGADMVLGAHPHVLQPIVYLNDNKCLVAYSLGNFVSGMSSEYKDLGGVLKVEITKKDDVIEMVPDFMGTWVKRSTDANGMKTFTVVPLPKDKIPDTIPVTKAEEIRLEMYRKFIDTKIKTYTSKS